MLKSDIAKLAEQLRSDYELFKAQQNQLTGKMTEMIKLEVDTRLACDTENRALNEAAIKRIIEELGVFKDSVERQNKKFANDMKESNAENSERAEFLSRYVDAQVKKLDEQIEEQLKKIKILCAKLTAQVKEHFRSEEESTAKLINEMQESRKELTEQVEKLKADHTDSLNDIGAWMSMRKIEETVSSTFIYEALNTISKDSASRLSLLETATEALITSQAEQSDKCEQLHSELSTKTSEEIERKLQALMERLSGENIAQWNQSVRLTEKVMSPEGVKEALDVAPPGVLGMKDIRKVLSAMAEEQARPKLAAGDDSASSGSRKELLQNLLPDNLE
eukprot:TRINITY_DN3714_c0_g1_i4.p1 TRINITY_DN3714_c0_g1~~TRINITY_DN3714_c0_g1_i4.p1  ORF type:complete len:335 (+),score=120.27 TRINITY_DN3714_c0_g1_i4:1535-2539(+)